MRSKIEANEYKDYILGFIFYKFLSDQLVEFVSTQGMRKEDIESLNEDDTATVEFIQSSLGYFISYEGLFSTWIDPMSDFDESNVRDALSAFSRLIHRNHKKLFEGIFTTLETGLSKLGENASRRTKAISDLLHLIKSIPMNGKQGYDVLGYIYEYLIEKFAANAGKKAGEFYTPHEVSVLMSHIIAHELKHKDTIEIYDPTSGSGSLLINIGEAVEKNARSRDSITYYAQELKANTFNLTRMNLIMRGIKANNIKTRNGDTLEDDWPYFDDGDPQGSYQPLYVDAVVSNPPYSQKWDPIHKENDPRYSRFGLAPKTKADFAFLLHDLYHLKPDGIMTIVLPHGVLFRGGEEGEIRKRLIEDNHIDAVIGLPSNIFFGTSIPTVILVLKQKRIDSDVLIIDASKQFKKEGKNNKLKASNIKRIVDAFVDRKNRNKFSQVVEKQVLRDNGYNLNIPRYVDSSVAPETWDLHATMLGGIPNNEIEELGEYWQAFPQLRSTLFTQKSEQYSELTISRETVNTVISLHPQVKAFAAAHSKAFDDYESDLINTLILNWQSVSRNQQEDLLSSDLFRRLAPIALIDKYQAYQHLNNQWQIISADLEMIQTEGFASTNRVDPNIVIKKKDGKDTEVQDGWKGRIIPFELVQTNYLHQDVEALKALEKKLAEATYQVEEIIESLTEEEKNSTILNDKNDAFVKTELSKALKDIYSDLDSKEIYTLNRYISLLEKKAKKNEKLSFIEINIDVNWHKIQANKDGTYSKANVNTYLKTLKECFAFESGTFESKVIKADKLLSEQTKLKADIKSKQNELHLKTKKTIEDLKSEQVKNILRLKWITPLARKIDSMPSEIINQLTRDVQDLSDKYATTYSQIAQDIKAIEHSLSQMTEKLTGSKFEMQGLAELTSSMKDQ